MSQPPLIDQLKSWCSLKALRSNFAEYVENQKGNVFALEKYAEIGQVWQSEEHRLAAMAVLPPDWEEPMPSRDSLLRTQLFVYGRMKVCHQQCAELSHQSLDEWCSAVLAVELHSLLAFLVESEFPGKFGRNLGMMRIELPGWLGLAAGIGMLDVLDRWAPLLVEAMRREYVLGAKNGASHCGLHHFILRLWCVSRGVEYLCTHYPKYEVAEGVLAMWDTSDTVTLAAWLVQLCNQHTQLTRAKQFMDFVNDFSHVPVEILMLFRLREQRGLPNPEVDHPLMRFPWSKLAPVIRAKPDEIVTGVYQRLKVDERITRDGLYQTLLG